MPILRWTHSSPTNVPLFPFSPTPFRLPLSGPLIFLRDCNPEHILKFLDAQLDRLGDLARDSSLLESAWRGMIHAQIAPAAGRVKPNTLTALAPQCNLGDRVWLQHFLFGFKLVVDLPQHRCYAIRNKEARKTPLPLERVLRSPSARFSDRDAKSGSKNAQVLRGEAISQQKKGWLTSPFELGAPKDPFTLSCRKLKASFLFGVEQGVMPRTCGDLRYHMAHLACVVRASAKLVSWGHLAEISRLAASWGRDLH